MTSNHSACMFSCNTQSTVGYHLCSRGHDMSERVSLEPVLTDADERLETAHTLVDFVRNWDVDRLLRDADVKRSFCRYSGNEAFIA